ncbi:MAG: hypothetical protein C4531_12550 [Desulfurivibrio sp.]|jgi:hypothetical protein|nr:MAG: hypothetical protein C4531_12550 [Desulfurivibrio sp.]
MLEQKNHCRNEDGFVLVASLLILLILVIIGIAATNNSIIELQIAGNEKVHKQTFYQADGGADLASRVTFENSLCINMGGFAANPAGLNGGREISQLEVLDLDFAAPTGATAAPLPSDAVRDVVFYPGNRSDNTPHTNMTVVGRTDWGEGTEIGQVMGYEGGPGPGGSGFVYYSINSQHRGAVNSESVIELGWKISSYLIDSASSYDCNFD